MNLNNSYKNFLLIYIPFILFIYSYISNFYFLIISNIKNSIITSNNIKFNVLFLFILFNMAGLLPFSIFLIKWYSIFLFIKLNNLIVIIILMIFKSSFILFICNNILFYSLFLFESKLIKLNHYNNNIFIYLLFPSFLSFIIIII